jgi:hypothetical protein
VPHFVFEGVARLLILAAIGIPNATVTVLKSLGLCFTGFLFIEKKQKWLARGHGGHGVASKTGFKTGIKRFVNG